eukprot:RCo040312
MANLAAGLVTAGVAALSGFYLSATGRSYFRKPPTPEARLARFETLAQTWDVVLGPVETEHGIVEMRKRLLSHVPSSAVVLETAAGTGRNVPLYPPTARVTLTELVPGMVRVLRDVVSQQLTKENLEAGTAARPAKKGRGTAEPVPRMAVAQSNMESLPFAKHSFDVVVDTFGLCSTDNPSVALAEMFRVLKPGGQLLLLEHGEGDGTFIRFYQKLRAPQHLHDWGCFFNRPIHHLVEESKFEIQEIDRTHKGTTILVRALRPRHIDDLFAEKPAPGRRR